MMRDRPVRGGVLTWVHQDQIRSWRKKVARNLRNREGRRVVLERDWSNDKSLAPVDTDDAGHPIVPVARKRGPSDFASPREVAESEAVVVAEQMLMLAKTDPEGFRRKMEDLRQATGFAYSHMSDDELTRAMIEVCRRAVVEPTVQRVWETQGFADHFYKGDLNG